MSSSPPDFLTLPGVRTNGLHGTAAGFLVEAEVDPSSSKQCPECGTGRLHGHGKRSVMINDMPHFGNPTRIKLTYRRFRCTSCRANTTDLPPVIDPQRTMTVRLREHIENQPPAITKAQIASALGLAESRVTAVRDAFFEHLARAFRHETPEVIGIDEVHVKGRRHGPLLVISAPKGNRILDLLPNTKAETLRAALNGLHEPENVRVVTIDMTAHYRDAVVEALPNATVVVDRWHVQRQVVEAVQTARKKYTKEISDKARKKLKEQHYLIAMRRFNLTEAQQKALSDWLAASPLLAAAYQLKERFCDIYSQCHSSSKAIDAFEEWKSSFPVGDGIPQSEATRLAEDVRNLFSRIVKLVEDWCVEIFGWFDLPPNENGRRPSQGHAENRNRFVKEVFRNANGMKISRLRSLVVYTPESRGWLVPVSADMVTKPANDNNVTADSVTG